MCHCESRRRPISSQPSTFFQWPNLPKIFSQNFAYSLYSKNITAHYCITAYTMLLLGHRQWHHDTRFSRVHASTSVQLYILHNGTGKPNNQQNTGQGYLLEDGYSVFVPTTFNGVTKEPIRWWLHAPKSNAAVSSSSLLLSTITQFFTKTYSCWCTGLFLSS